MAANNRQLAIINPEIPDNYLSSEETIQLLPFMIENDELESSFSLHFRSFSLIDDPTVICQPELCCKDWSTAYVNISFLTEVPPSYEYELSLYYVNKVCKLVKLSYLTVKNITKNYVAVLLCKSIFENLEDSLLYTREFFKISVENFAFCLKISRKDILANLNKKPALLLSTQVTDCSLLFEHIALTNFIIIVEGKIFRVHKEILAAKSSVFLSMFECEMKEKKDNEVTIDDIEAETFQEFLRYIYTNIVNDLNVHAEKLFIVAEKYDVAKLKSVCIDELSRSLKVENAVHTLKLGDRYGAKCLKDRSLGFIRNHIKSIFETEEYKVLYKTEQAYLLNEILQAVSI